MATSSSTASPNPSANRGTGAIAHLRSQASKVYCVIQHALAERSTKRIDNRNRVIRIGLNFTALKILDFLKGGLDEKDF